MALAPIALFVYNRPVHVRRAVEALQKNALVANTDVYIFSDAPKKAKSSKAVCEVRDYIKTITGFRTITIIEREKNWGLANSVIDGVTQLCNEYGRVIVLEDDLLPSKYFLEYMNKALDRYEDASQVMQVSGHMFPVDTGVSGDSLFLPITTTWGWATWKRAWEKFDPDARAYVRLVEDAEMRRKFNMDGAYPCMKMLESSKDRKVDAWGIRWYLSVFMNDGLVLFPARSLIENRGFDAEGTNCGPQINSNLFSQPTSEFRVENFPLKEEYSEHAFGIIKEHLYTLNVRGGLLVRVVKRFHASCRRIVGAIIDK